MLKWIQESYESEVVALCIDIGQAPRQGNGRGQQGCNQRRSWPAGVASEASVWTVLQKGGRDLASARLQSTWRKLVDISKKRRWSRLAWLLSLGKRS